MTPQPSEQPRTAAGQRLMDLFIADTEVPGQLDWLRLRQSILAIEAEAAAPDSVASPAPLDAHAFLDSLRSPRNSLGKLALPKGPMEWAVADAWDEATSPVGDPEDGIEMHELSVLADAIIDHLHPRLEGQPVAEEPSE